MAGHLQSSPSIIERDFLRQNSIGVEIFADLIFVLFALIICLQINVQCELFLYIKNLWHLAGASTDWKMRVCVQLPLPPTPPDLVWNVAAWIQIHMHRHAAVLILNFVWFLCIQSNSQGHIETWILIGLFCLLELPTFRAQSCMFKFFAAEKKSPVYLFQQREIARNLQRTG